jgi:hypothetical protein
MLPLQNEIFDLILVEKYVYELFRLESITNISQNLEKNIAVRCTLIPNHALLVMR